MSFNLSQIRKALPNVRSGRSSTLSSPRSNLILLTWLLVIVSSIATSLPGFVLALNLMIAYILMALLAIRLIPELLQVAQRWKWMGMIAGISLFAITTTPAQAAIFDTAEKYTTQIFGPYIDGSMITLIFGFLRISSFILGAAFVLLALEKARHGENWQPFAWNAFAVLMIVVLVEGMSTLFLSTTTTTTTKPAP